MYYVYIYVLLTHNWITINPSHCFPAILSQGTWPLCREPLAHIDPGTPSTRHLKRVAIEISPLMNFPWKSPIFMKVFMGNVL